MYAVSTHGHWNFHIGIHWVCCGFTCIINVYFHIDIDWVCCEYTVVIEISTYAIDWVMLWVHMHHMWYCITSHNTWCSVRIQRNKQNYCINLWPSISPKTQSLVRKINAIFAMAIRNFSCLVQLPIHNNNYKYHK